MGDEHLFVQIRWLILLTRRRWHEDQFGGVVQLLPQDLFFGSIKTWADGSRQALDEVEGLWTKILVRTIELENGIPLASVDKVVKASPPSHTFSPCHAEVHSLLRWRMGPVDEEAAARTENLALLGWWKITLSIEKGIPLVRAVASRRATSVAMLASVTGSICR